MSASPIRPQPPAAGTPVQRTKPVGSAPPPEQPKDTISISAHAPTRRNDDALAHLADRPTEAPSRQEALVEALLAHVPPADRDAARTAIPAILDAARRSGTTDPNRVGYLLATAQTESDFGAHMTETGHSRHWYDAAYGCADGNRPGTDDGYRYRGRGYVQTTHEGRYAELSRHLGLPDDTIVRNGKPLREPELVAHPDRLSEPELAAQALVVGVTKNLFTENRSAALDATIPVGRPPGQADFYHARGIVNGIVPDQAHAIARHATTYARIVDGFRHSVLGVPEKR
jgi:predicted chitinase